MASITYNDKEIKSNNVSFIEYKNEIITIIHRDNNEVFLKLNGIQIGEAKGEIIKYKGFRGFWINKIYIKKEYRKKGYGKILLNELLKMNEDVDIYGVDAQPFDVDLETKSYDEYLEELINWYSLFSIDDKKIEPMPNSDSIYQKLEAKYEEEEQNYKFLNIVIRHKVALICVAILFVICVLINFVWPHDIFLGSSSVIGVILVGSLILVVVEAFENKTGFLIKNIVFSFCWIISSLVMISDADYTKIKLWMQIVTSWEFIFMGCSLPDFISEIKKHHDENIEKNM